MIVNGCLSMWLYDKVATCPGCNTAFELGQLGWAPAPPRPRVRRSSNRKGMDEY